MAAPEHEEQGRWSGFREDNRLLIELFRGPFGKFYLAMMILTLLMQIHFRAPVCAGFLACSASYLKGAVWSVLWPLYWPLYFTDFVLIRAIFNLP